MKEASSQEFSGSRRRAVRTILAVGDDRTSLGELAQRLGSLGYLVVLGDSGAQALELISARGFDLLLLDLTGSDHCGLHVIQEIRSARDTADMPILLLAAKGGEGAIVEALTNGADDCLAGSYGFPQLAARIERTLCRAARIEELKRCNLALDARIAARAMELGEARSELAGAKADRARLIESIQSLHDEIDRLQDPS